MPGAGASLPVDVWHVQALANHHSRAAFDCGEQSLNEYLQRYVTQDSKRHLTRAYVLTESASNHVSGYYTLSATNIQRERFPAQHARRLPRYPVPAVLLGRLAVDRSLRGQGLGEHLLVDALKRVGHASSTIGVHAILVEAISDRAAKYYASYGFISLTDPPRTLFLPIESVLQMR
jgi:predicted GNAT family N-acyltransferase